MAIFDDRSMIDGERESDLADPSDGVCVAHLDHSLRLTGASDGFLAQLGVPAAGIYGLHIAHLVHQSVKPRVLPHLVALVEGRLDRFSHSWRGARDAGAPFTGSLIGFAVRGADRHINTIVLLVTPEGAPHRSQPLNRTSARVLEGVAGGQSTTQLAGRLFLSRQGVDYHIGALLRRFGCPNRPALVAKAYAESVLTAGTWPPRVSSACVE
jgi:DNA-binding CsgD family transcriptional regulator